MSATADTEPIAPPMPEKEPEIPTVQIAWATYDLTERELWEDYAAADYSYLAGRIYVTGEQLARRRCERAVRHARYTRTPVAG